MEWTNVDSSLPEDKFKKYLVKSGNGKIHEAFFMPDKIIWIAWYGKETSYWMEINSGKLIYNVNEWMLLPKPLEN